MNVCPRCSRPLEPGEELCPSCKSKNDREKKEGFLWTLSDPFGLQRLVLRQIKKKWMRKRDNA